MIIKPRVEDLLTKCSNRYELVIAVSRRARQLEKVGSNKIESKITNASIELNNGECYIIDQNDIDINE